MEMTKFIEPFPSSVDANFKDEHTYSIDKLEFELNEDIKHNIETGHEWSMIFSDLLRQRLAGSLATNGDELRDYFINYENWVNNSKLSLNLFDLYETLPINSHGRSIVGRELTHSFFHIQNNNYLLMWHHLLTNSGPITDRNIYVQTQKDASLQGVADALFRDKLVENDSSSYYTNLPGSQRAFMEGLLGEHDSGVVLLQAAKTQKTNWTILPAPAAFEHSASGANSDYIVVSPNDDQVIGVQVKNWMGEDSKDLKRYDQSRVVLVDTSVDFGNQKYVQYKNKNGGAVRRTVGYNGLMCLESLRTAKLSKEELLATQGLASYAQSKNKDYGKRLVLSSEIIKARILEKM